MYKWPPRMNECHVRRGGEREEEVKERNGRRRRMRRKRVRDRSR